MNTSTSVDESFATYSLWEDAFVKAQRDPNAFFWTMPHTTLLEKSELHASMLVSGMWDTMGPSAHAWFCRFLPDVRKRFPLETEHSNPWNAQVAYRHYGLAPTFNSKLFDSQGIKKTSIPASAVVSSWLALREQCALPTTPWQLVQEMVHTYHQRDHMPIELRPIYLQDVNSEQMAVLHRLCPSDDWGLAMACAGIATDAVKKSAMAKYGDHAQMQAAAWLDWWLEKSPHCLDNLTYAWTRSSQAWHPPAAPETAMLMDMMRDAKTPLDVFPLVRQLYDKAPECNRVYSIALPDGAAFEPCA